MFKVYLFILFTFLVSANAVFGCTCGHSSIAESFEQADAIVVAKAISFKPASFTWDTPLYEGDDKVVKTVREEVIGQQVKIEISRWFKGEDQQKVIYLSQPSSTCDKEFKAADLSKTFLFYLFYNKKNKASTIIACGRSHRIEGAADDLSWLSGLPGSLNRTRLAGTIRFNDYQDMFPTVAGVKIKITGKGKVYELVSDKNGLYEIWDVPAGDYEITAEMPDDKKIDWTVSTPNDVFDIWYQDEPEPDGSKVTLAPKSSGGIDFMLVNKWTK
jgi:hypothetical protein